MLFHTKLCRVCKKKTNKEIFWYTTWCFLYIFISAIKSNVRHQDIKSSEQGLKRRKVIRTVKKGIVDKVVLNEPRNAYIAGGYLKRFTFYFLDLVFSGFFWYGKHDISKCFYRMIVFHKCSYNY